jgi:hypothetical protein
LRDAYGQKITISVAVSKHWKQAMQFLEIKMAAGWLGIRTALPVMPLLLL